MQKFVGFIRKIYVFLLFVVLEIVALNIYADSSNYTRAKMLSATTVATGGIYSITSDIGSYFRLKSENRILTEEISRLLNRHDDSAQEGVEEALPMIHGSFTALHGRYEYMPATVIKNTITLPRNFITIDKGRGEGVEPNMAIITPDGRMAGYVVACSDRYCVGISVLNTDFRTAGTIYGKDYFGSIRWDGVDPQTVTLTEIPKYADLVRGDSIVTGHSSIFPPDLLIGTISDFRLTNSNYYDVEVSLAAPMSRLRNVILIRYADILERSLLEQEAEYSMEGNRR